MGLEDKPVHRHYVRPWYDTRLACRITFWLLFPMFLFGFVGVLEALQTELWRQNVWIPLVISLATFGLMVKISWRVIRREMVARQAERGDLP